MLPFLVFSIILTRNIIGGILHLFLDWHPCLSAFPGARLASRRGQHSWNTIAANSNSRNSGDSAKDRGISCVRAIAEALPFANCSFDYALSVTTICFVEDARAMMSEAYRVLKPGGELVTGFIDRASDLGKHYLAHQSENVFYGDATFYSAVEVERLLHDTGFTDTVWVQTLSKTLDEIHAIEPLCAGCGQGAFVVVKAKRP